MMSITSTNTTTGTPQSALARTISRFEALLSEAEHLATFETGQAKAFNQGRASAFESALDALREVQS